MSNHEYCHSCGLEIVPGKLDFGTMEDGSPSSIFCELCCRQGKILTAEMTKEQIIEQSTQAFINRFGWKNAKNAAAEARNRISLSSRFGNKHGRGLSWKVKLIFLIIFVATWLVLKFLIK